MPRQLQGLGPWGHLLLQLFLGFIFVLHGSQKLFGPSFYGFPWEGYVGFFNKLGLTPAPFWEYNAKLPIELVLYDDESSPEKSVELYEKLAAVDKGHLFIGPGSSPITLRASTVAERLKIPMLLVEANSPIIYARGFQWIAGVDRPAQYWAGPYFDLIKELREKRVVDYRSIAFLIEDHPHTKDVAEGAVELAKKAGLDVVERNGREIPLRRSVPEREDRHHRAAGRRRRPVQTNAATVAGSRCETDRPGARPVHRSDNGLTLLGAHALEGLGLAVDPVRKVLEPSRFSLA